MGFSRKGRSWWIGLSRWLWKNLGFFWGTILLGIGLNLLASWFANPTSLDFHSSPFAWVLHNAPIAISVGCGLLLLTLSVGIVYYFDERTHPLPTTPKPQDRRRFLEKLMYRYTEVLRQSLRGATMIALGLHERYSITYDSSHLVLLQRDQPDRILPPGTSIFQAYTDAGQELLILGEPGAGKSTLLSELACDLVHQAEQNGQQLLPVIFPLSSWAIKRPPLTEWFIEQLTQNYEVPPALSRFWVYHDQILPLLDGLDELPENTRSNCINAINAYKHEHLVPMVVCSRSTEYLSLQKHLVLHTAVVIQPLSKQQIEAYLENAGKPVAVIRTALRKNRVLYELVTTPLMLNILILAFQGKSSRSLPKLGSAEEQQQYILSSYVERMFEHKGISPKYLKQQTIDWLIWLANQLKEHHLTEFYIERIQMDWLPKHLQRELYIALVVGLISGLLDAMMNTVAYAYINSFYGLLIGGFNALVYIFLNGFFYIWLTQQEKKLTNSQVWMSNIMKLLGSRTAYGLIMGSLDAIFISLLIEPVTGLINGVCYGAFFGVLGRLETEIRPAEVIVWSWANVRQNAFKFLLGGLIAGVFYGFLTARLHFLNPVVLLSSLVFGICVGLVIGLVLALLGGFSQGKLEAHKIVKPNQGIRNSAYNSTVLASLSGLTFAALFYFCFSSAIYRIFNVGDTTFLPPASGLVYGTTNGLAIAFFVWMRNGGLACIQHFYVRILLSRKKCIPWNYIHFLEYANKHIILRKVGGGYTFAHRLLLEYFASLQSGPHSPLV